MNGARPLKQMIQQRTRNPVASDMLTKYTEGYTIHVNVNASKHDFSFTKTAEVPEGELVA